MPQTWFLSPQALCWCNKQLHLVRFKTKPVVPSTELKSLQWLARACSQGTLSISAVKHKKTLCQSVSEYNTVNLPASPRDHLKDFWILLGKSIFFFTINCSIFYFATIVLQCCMPFLFFAHRPKRLGDHSDYTPIISSTKPPLAVSVYCLRC